MTAIVPPTLLAQPVIGVQQKAKLFELRNTYTLSDQHGAPLGTVAQVNQSALTVVVRVLSDLDVVLPVELQVTQGTEPVLTLRKPWFTMKVLVSDAQGRVVGSIRKQLRMGKARFTLLDASGIEVGEVRAENWRAKDFMVADRNGLEVARVGKKWAGFAKEFFTDADNYVIELPPQAVDPLRTLAFALRSRSTS